jgi:hypothetical protein
MFVSATGVNWSQEDLERAIRIRNHKRTRADDESVIPLFQQPEWWANPLLGEKQGMDPRRSARC